MSVYVSPGVYTRELDISTIVPNLSSTIGAIVGYSEKGSTTDIQLVTNSQQFIDQYGKPPAMATPNTYFHYSALAFLERGNRLYCMRVANTALYGGAWLIKNAGAGANTSLLVGSANRSFQTVGGQDILFYIFGVNPGAWNNNINIKIPAAKIFGAPLQPGAPSYQFDIEVYTKDADGNYLKVEVWTVSRKHKTDGYGKQMYITDQINGYSAYIWVTVPNPEVEVDTVNPTAQDTYLPIGGGDSGSTPTDGQVINGWNMFANPDDIDIRILINAGYTSTAVQGAMKSLAETRADCIAILDIPNANLTSVSSMVSWRTGVQNFNSTYCALYTPWVTIYDSYNDKIVNVPPSGYVAAQIAYNDYVAEPWYAPAGFNRGLLNVLGLTNVFTQGDRDTLYSSQLNPIQTFRGEGTVVWGQKTEKFVPSALDRVNVRRLLITLEKAMSVALRAYCFEPNTGITRLRVSTTLEQYLDLLSARGAFQTELGDKGYRVVCNTTNNTPATIDANELHVDVFIKPVRTAEIIELQAIITQTGASFEELIAQGVMF